LILLFSVSVCFAQSKTERSYAEDWAAKNGGKTEVTMPDKSRCDIVTATHAIEVKRGYLWKSAIGQSLWYSFQTNKAAGIILILEKKTDHIHAVKLQSLIREKKVPIRVWLIEAWKLPKKPEKK